MNHSAQFQAGVPARKSRHHCLAVLFAPAAALLLCLPAGVAPVPAQAQQTAVLEEVIVTAQKREESLQEAPLAVTAFTQSDIEATGAIEFGTIAHKAPNVTIRKQTSTHANYAFNLRGVAEGDPSLTVEPAIAVYMDGVYLGRISGMAFDISDTERVEVLRGPQGTLYGRNATGGAINVISARPGEDFSFSERLTVGDRGLTRIQFTVNTGSFPSFAGGTMSARLNLSLWDFDGTVKSSATEEDLGGIDSEMGRLALRWVGDGMTVDYSLQRSNKSGQPHTQQITGVDTFNEELAGTAGLTAAYKQIKAMEENAIRTAVTAQIGNTIADAELRQSAINRGVLAEIYQRAAAAAAAGGNILAAFAAPEPPDAADLAVTGALEFAGAFGATFKSDTDFAIFNQAAQAASVDRVGGLPMRRHKPETSDFDAHALTIEWETPAGVLFKSITSYRDWESAIKDLGTDSGTFVYGGTREEQICRPGQVDMNPATCPKTTVTRNNAFTVWREDGAPVAPRAMRRGELVSLFAASRDSEQEQFTQEFQFSGELLGGQLNYVAGLYYFQEQSDEENQQWSVVPGIALPFLGGVTQAANFDPTLTDNAAAVQATIAIAGAVPGTFHGYGSGALCGDPNLSQGVVDLTAALATFNVLATGVELPENTLTLARACLDAVVVGGQQNYNYGTDNEAWAVYWHGQYLLNDRISLTAGVRYTEDDKEAYQQRRSAAVSSLNSPLGTVEADESWSKFTWDFSADYQWMEDVHLYARVATSYRAGGFTASATPEGFPTPVDEETILSYEVGAKTQWFDNRVRLNLTAFYLDYEDRVVSNFIPGLAGAAVSVQNFGEQTHQGFELELLAVPFPGLTVGLNYGYTDVDIDKPEDVSYVDPSRVGDAPVEPFAPDNTAYAWVQYEFPASSYGALDVRIEYDYADQFTISPLSPLNDPVNRGTERELWNARISLTDIPLADVDRGRLSVAFWGRNLLNEEYRDFVVPFGVFSVGIYGELRSFGFDLVYEH